MFTAIFTKTEGIYSAWVEELPGVNTQGSTKSEAEMNLRDALKEYILARRMLTKKNGGSYTRKRLLVS